ncbi:MAG: hypothetical protein KAT43_06330 [Nanoarchaeota archaeon]|nr:hypothetical protein [Nanoarchaeota archaeon]
MTDKMHKELSLNCDICDGSCCYRGTPLYLPGERDIVVAEVPDHFEELRGSFVIPKPKGYCPYLNTEKKCSIQHLKGTDCQIYPSDPFYDDELVEFVIDMNCPVQRTLTPKFVAMALYLGAEWIHKFPKEDFDLYWDRFKRNNPEQNYTTVHDFLQNRGDRFISKVQENLRDHVDGDLSGWLRKVLFKNNLTELLVS